MGQINFQPMLYSSRKLVWVIVIVFSKKVVWVLILFLSYFFSYNQYSMCWCEVFMKTMSLGSMCTLTKKIVAHANFHANFLPTLIGLFCVVGTYEPLPTRFPLQMGEFVLIPTRL